MWNRQPSKQEIQHLELCKKFFFEGRPHVSTRIKQEAVMYFVADRYFDEHRLTLPTRRDSFVPNIVSSDVEIQYLGPEVRSRPTLEGG